MGWPFQQSSQQKSKEMKAVSSKKGFLDKLLGNTKTEASSQVNAPGNSQMANTPSNQWDLPDASFDAVAKLLEETQQKAPNQPLPTNPYRSSLTLDEDDSVEPLQPAIQELSQPQVPQQKVAQASWAFDASQLNLGKQGENAPEMFLDPVDQLVMEDGQGLSAPEVVMFDDTVIQPSVEFENNNEDEESLDDFGLNLSPQALPQGSSLRKLMDDNVLTFISSKPVSEQGFKIEAEMKQLQAVVIEDESNAQADWLLPTSEPEAFEGFNDTERQAAFSTVDEAVSDDWFNSPVEEATQDLFTFESESDLELSIQSVEDLPEEAFSEEVLEIISETSDSGALSQPFSENSFPQVADTVVSESSWFDQGLTDATVVDEAYAFDSPLDFDISEPLGLEPMDLDNEEDDFQVISLDSDDGDSAEENDNEFFSGKYQFSLDNIDENSVVLEPDESAWFGFNDSTVLPEQMATNVSIGDGLFEFQAPADPTGQVALDLDEDIASYQDFIGNDDEAMGDDVIFDLSNDLSSNELASIELLQMASESIEDIPEVIIESHTSIIDEICLEPPPIVAEESSQFQPPVPKVEKRLSSQIVTFEANVLLQETRFTKRSIDHLVSQYFGAGQD